MPQRLRDRFVGERPVEPHSKHSDLVPFGPQGLDDVPQLVGERPQPHDDVFRVVAAVRLHEGHSPPPEDLLERGVGLLHHLHGLPQVFRQQVADLHVTVGQLAVDVQPGLGERHRVEVGRIGRVQSVGRLERLQKLPHLLLFRHSKGHIGVRQQVAVVAHHHRDAGGFRHREGLQGVVDDLLVIAAVHLDPPGVALGDGVLVVVPDVPGGAHGPVGHAHDDG